MRESKRIMVDDSHEDVQFLIRQWCIGALHYKEILEIGRAMGLKVSCPVTTSNDRRECKVLIGLNI